jgi:dienelactone hydrolase
MLSRVQFDPVEMLDARAGESCGGFAAKTAAEARAWQKRTRKMLGECLGFLDEKKVDPRPRLLGSVDRGSYVRRRIVIRTSRFSELPLYLLVPKGSAGPMPCVLALHGHGYGVKDIVGLWEDGSERLSPDGYHKDFGCALAERGFVVAAPEISCFGERQHHYADAALWRLSPTCHNASTYAIMLGKSVAGMRVLDGLRVVDYLRTRKEIGSDRIGVMGISGGGMHAFFSAAMDRRIKASVISGYFCDWRQSILSLFHCTCNFVPGLLRLGELSDLAGLIAPRPCLVEHGVRDDIFPIEHVKRTVSKARRAWEIFGAGTNLETHYFEGRHRISGELAYGFLAEHLGRPS